MSHPPTDEQSAIIDAYLTGRDLVVEAGAGTGKTSTLERLGAANPRRRALYIAYNKSIATEAQRRFARNVRCVTSHSLAYQAVGKVYRHRLNGGRVPAQQAARVLRIRHPLTLGDDVRPFAPARVARLVMQTIQAFCYSAEERPRAMHVPQVMGLSHAGHAALCREILPLAERAWDDLVREDGCLQFSHDVYLKLFQLSRPTFGAETVYLDEAQDSNPCVAAMVQAQDAQRVLVGDTAQQIYGWRGADNAMAKFDVGQRLFLTQSFRFGDRVAAEANKWLGLLPDTTLRVKGFGKIPSVVGTILAPDAVLCRSNAGCVSAAVAELAQGRPTAIAGGADGIRRMAEAAIELRAGRGTSHPELFAFESWGHVQEYVSDDPGGGDLRVFVDLVDAYGPEGVLRICDALSREEDAGVVCSTAHKSKGREWGRVQIGDDFVEPRPTPAQPVPKPAPDDVRLAYVAVTRAREQLDVGSLAWVDDYLTGRPLRASYDFEELSA